MFLVNQFGYHIMDREMNSLAFSVGFRVVCRRFQVRDAQSFEQKLDHFTKKFAASIGQNSGWDRDVRDHLIEQRCGHAFSCLMADGKKPQIAGSRVNHGQNVLEPPLASTVLPFRKGTNQVSMDNGHRAKFPHGL